MYYTWKNVKKSFKENKFKISSPTWNEKFDLPDGTYPDIQDYFEYILKTLRKTNNLLITIYINKIENILEFKIKTGYYLKLLTPETKKLFGITWKILEVVLVHCNIVNNNYQQDSVNYEIFQTKVLYFLKPLIQSFLIFKYGFADQNSKPLEIGAKINITLVIS